MRCSRCRGLGKVHSGALLDLCPVCRGSGQVPELQELADRVGVDLDAPDPPANPTEELEREAWESAPPAEELVDPPAFDGGTFDPEEDEGRLTTQLERVRELMEDERWRTLADIADGAAPCSEASASARLRDLRKAKHGRRCVDRRRIDGGLYEYRLRRTG